MLRVADRVATQSYVCEPVQAFGFARRLTLVDMLFRESQPAEDLLLEDQDGQK